MSKRYKIKRRIRRGYTWLHNRMYVAVNSQPDNGLAKQFQNELKQLKKPTGHHQTGSYLLAHPMALDSLKELC